MSDIKNELLGNDSSSSDSDSVHVVLDKAEEGELQIEQMEDANAYEYEVNRDKPWLKPGADITDYFNYGFTEKTWLKYCEMQKERRGFVENNTVKDNTYNNSNSNLYNYNNNSNLYNNTYNNTYNSNNTYNNKKYKRDYKDDYKDDYNDDYNKYNRKY